MGDLVPFSGRFYYLLHPRPTVVLITLCPGGRVNAMPASWNTPVSEEPPTVAVAVDRESYTHKCLQHHPEATINIPPAELVDKVYALGTVSGDEIDKISKYGLKLEPSETVKPPTWAEAIGVIEAKVIKTIDIGEVTLYIFQALKTKARKGTHTRYGWDFRKTNILLHNAGRAFYQVGKLTLAKKTQHKY